MRNMKMRLLSFVLAVAMMFAVMPVSAFAADDTTAYDVTVSKPSTDPNKSALQQALEETYPDIDLNNVKKLTVTTRGVELHKDDFAFMSGTKVTGTAADRYKYERPSDFVYLANLEEVNLSKATCENDTIPPRAFFCDKNITNKITKIVLPDNLKVIDFAAFCGMTELTYLGTTENLHFPSTLTSMGESMVNGAKKLTGEVTLPPNLERIGAACFVNSGVSGRVYVDAGLNLSQNVNSDVQKSKGDCSSLFYGTDITYLEFQNGVTKIPNSIASKCFKLKEVVIPNTVTEIGETAFFLTSLSGTIVIPKAVTKIGNGAFRQEEVTVDKDGTLARTYSDSELLEHIIIENPSVELDRNAFLSKNNKLKLYFTSDSDKIQSYKNWVNGYWYNSKTVILNTNEGTIAHDSNGNVTAKLDDTTGLYTPTKDGYKFVGWYEGETKLTGAAQAGKNYTAHWAKLYTVTFNDGVNNSTVQVAEGENVEKPKTDPKKDGYKFDGWYKDKNCTEAFDFRTAITENTTVYAKWTAYETNVNADVKVNADPADKTVEITVNVTADPTELDGATATLNFTDANGNDDSANVAEVAVDGKKLDSYKNVPIAGLMNGGSDTATVATYAATQNKTAKLTVTYKTPGEHNVEIVLNAANGDVICKQTATVKIAPEPGTLNLTACTAKLSDGTEVKNGDKVPVGTDVTVTFDKDFYADSNLVLSGWQVKPEDLTDINGKLVKDITADSFTFLMPEAENGVTIEALTKTADTEDDSWDAATVVTGVAIGAGAAVLTYHIGTELYAEQVLGKGVAVPKTRAEVALKAWELAGKPAVAVEGEPLSEAAQAEKWAVESGLMQNDAEGSFNGAKKMNKLKALRVLDAAKKLNAQ